MPQMTKHELREHKFKIDVSSFEDKDRLLYFFMSHLYPTQRTKIS